MTPQIKEGELALLMAIGEESKLAQPSLNNPPNIQQSMNMAPLAQIKIEPVWAPDTQTP